jgi:hypothetical protein
MNRRQSLIAAALTSALAFTSAYAQKTPGYNNKIPESILTPNTVQTRIGTLSFVDGVPTAETTQKVYDNLDFLRGVEVFLNFIPAASIESMRRGMIEAGASRSHQAVIFDNLMDSNPLFLTGNTDTVYCLIMLDLQADGPTVVEVPAGSGPGTVNDAFFRFVVDMGGPGPDKGKGGKYLDRPRRLQGRALPKDGILRRAPPSYELADPSGFPPTASRTCHRRLPRGRQGLSAEKRGQLHRRCSSSTDRRRCSTRSTRTISSFTGSWIT